MVKRITVYLGHYLIREYNRSVRMDGSLLKEAKVGPLYTRINIECI